MGTVVKLQTQNKHTLGVYVNLVTKQVFPVASKDIKKYQAQIESWVIAKNPGTSSIAKEMIQYGTYNFTYRTIACTEDDTTLKEWKRAVKDFVSQRGMYSFTFNSVEGLLGKLVQLTRRVSKHINTECEEKLT